MDPRAKGSISKHAPEDEGPVQCVFMSSGQGVQRLQQPSQGRPDSSGEERKQQDQTGELAQRGERLKLSVLFCMASARLGCSHPVIRQRPKRLGTIVRGYWYWNIFPGRLDAFYLSLWWSRTRGLILFGKVNT
jgi:hypothetical protein